MREECGDVWEVRHITFRGQSAFPLNNARNDPNGPCAARLEGFIHYYFHPRF